MALLTKTVIFRNQKKASLMKINPIYSYKNIILKYHIIKFCYLTKLFIMQIGFW